MIARVLVLEPDTELLESFRTYFERATDFDVRLTACGEVCISELRDFSPHVLVMEPALPPGMAQQVLDAVGASRERPVVSVLVLTRYTRDVAMDHPCVTSCLIKPQSLRCISNSIRQLATESVP